MTAPPPTAPWRIPALVALWAFALYHFSQNLVDVDLWGHVLFGQRMMIGGLERTDPFSWTAKGEPWVNHEILAEIVLGRVHQAAGGTGLLLLKVAVGFATFGIALRMGAKGIAVAKERALAQAALLLVAALAVVEISFGFAARPQIFTAIFLVSGLWLLRRIDRGAHPALAAAFPPLMALWINTHGGAMAGLAILFAAGAGMLAQALRAKESPRAGVAVLAGAFAGGAAMLANPYGWGLVDWLVGSILWLRPEIAEWNPPGFGLAEHFATLLLAAGTAWALLRTTEPRRWWEAVVLVCLAAAALRSVRHAPLFAIAALALVPGHLAAAFARDLLPRLGRLRDVAGSAGFQRGLAAGLLVLAAALVASAAFLRKNHPLTMEIPRGMYPVAAVEFIRAHGIRGNAIAFFDWGEMMIWELPDSRVSIDGRLDTAYPRPFIDAHWNFYRGEEFDRALFPAEQADFALLPVDLGKVRPFFAGAQGWSVAYADDLAVLLVRDRARFPKLPAAPVIAGAEAVEGSVRFPDGPSPSLTAYPF
jgi:hypothetical protein